MASFHADAAAAELPSAGVSTPAPVRYGKALREQFLFDPDYVNMNHGSFGSIPRAIQTKLRGYQDAVEARPDAFIRYEYPVLLDENRAAAAALLHAPVDTVVLVPNATTAIQTVLQNLSWNADGRDEILYFPTIYGACRRNIDYVVDGSGGKVASRAVDIAYPIEDAEIVARFRAAVAAAAAAGKRARVCVFDAVSSVPGVRFPFEAMVAACRALGVTSVVDGAQGVGMVPFDLAALDPDYFFTNCHKWLYVPRGCAVLYVPLRHQHRIAATLPVSHGYRPPARRPADWDGVHDEDGGNAMARLFSYVGTVDSSPFLCVGDAIRWRADVLGGEDAVVTYLVRLARDGAQACAAVLGTEVLDNATHTATACALANVRLPLALVGGDAPAPVDGHTAGVPVADAQMASDWMMKTLVRDYKTFIVVYPYRGQLWVRLSAQVYLDVADFQRAGEVLLALCARTARGEYRSVDDEQTGADFLLDCLSRNARTAQ